jgi:adenylylsulfate kinase-like enzyme
MATIQDMLVTSMGYSAAAALALSLLKVRSTHKAVPEPTVLSPTRYPLRQRGRRVAYFSDNQRERHSVNQKVMIVMVGLPARGKSYIVKKIQRYLTWIGYPSKLFNVGSKRRKTGLKAEKSDSNFFSASNKEASRRREELAMTTLKETLGWLNAQEGAAVAVFDATNTTKARRLAVLRYSHEMSDATILFIESVCNDQRILAQNYRMKLNNDDYKGMDAKKAMGDFLKRVVEYEKVYEPLDDQEDNGNIAYIKVFNVGRQIHSRLCQGYLPSQIVFYLSNIHITPRNIWLVRHGESVDNFERKNGGNGGLTKRGHAFSKALLRYPPAYPRAYPHAYPPPLPP